MVVGGQDKYTDDFLPRRQMVEDLGLGWEPERPFQSLLCRHCVGTEGARPQPHPCQQNTGRRGCIGSNHCWAHLRRHRTFKG